MTTSAVYDLIPNEDGGQNTRYPLGDKPAPEVAPPVPTYLNTSGETLTSVDLDWGQLGEGHTKFILQRWRLNTDTVWTTIVEPGKDDRTHTDSADLLEGQHVGYRIASSDGVNQSAWSPESWTYVLSEATGAEEWAGLIPTRIISTAAQLNSEMTNAVAGDVIGLEPGVYIGTKPDVDDSWLDNVPAFYPKNSGTAGARITFVARWPAAHHSNPAQYTEIRNGATQLSGYPAHGTKRVGWVTIGNGFNSPANYISWLGLYIYEKNSHMAEDCGVIGIEGNSSYQEIAYCKILGDLNGTSLYSPGQANNYSAVRLENGLYTHIHDNVFHDWRPQDVYINASSIITYSADDTLFEHNDIKNCSIGIWQKGVNATGKLNGNVNEGSIFRLNRIEGCMSGMRILAPSLEWPGTPTRDTIYHNNLFIDVQWGIDFTSSSSNYWGTQHKFYNNTFTYKSQPNSGEATVMFQEGGISNDGYLNNAYYNNIATGFNRLRVNYSETLQSLYETVDNPWDYNCFDGLQYMQNSSYTWAQWQATGADANSLNDTDPLFVGGGDYRLQAGSPAINAGQGGVTMGCYITGAEVIGIR